jgi:fatty acid desaturase
MARADCSTVRPRIPAAWYRPSRWWTAALLVYAPLLVLVPAIAARLLVAAVHPWPLAAIAILPFVVLGGYGFQLMGFVGHEGMHLSLMRNRFASACVGLFYASSVLSYLEMGFAAQHWTHHRFTNQYSDPDIRPVAHLDTWWKRVLLARATYNVEYVQTAWLLACGGEWPFRYRIPLPKRAIPLLARLNFAFAAAWMVVYALVALADGLTALVAVALPMCFALLISSCQTFLDHAGAGDEPYRNAWSRTSPLMTAVYFGANYHLEHHLYPGVPCYRLPRVHRLLRDAGLLARERANVQPSFLRAYAAVAAPYLPGRADFDVDPFVPAVASAQPAPGPVR